METKTGAKQMTNPVRTTRAEEFLENNIEIKDPVKIFDYVTNKVIIIKGKWVPIQNALEAVRLAREEEREKWATFGLMKVAIEELENSFANKPPTTKEGKEMLKWLNKKIVVAVREEQKRLGEWFEEKILEHKKCIKYHRVINEDWTCLDVIFKDLQIELERIIGGKEK